MNREQRRAAERVCAREGHQPKVDGEQHRYCARCGVDL